MRSSRRAVRVARGEESHLANRDQQAPVIARAASQQQPGTLVALRERAERALAAADIVAAESALDELLAGLPANGARPLRFDAVITARMIPVRSSNAA